MSSTTYRYYCLDGTGRLHDARWFDAGSDEEAVAHVQSKHPDGKCEIWEEQRLVATIKPSPTGRMVEDSLRAVTHARRLLRDTAGLTTQPYQPS